MDTKEKGAATNDAPKKIPDREIVADVKRVPQAPRLKTRYWEPARNIKSSIARVKGHLTHWKRVTEETAYLVGKEFLWIRNTRVSHGEFMDAVAQTGLHIRTAQRLMAHARECDQVNRLLPYHPNKSKGDTVSLLEPLPEKENLEEAKLKHEPGASKEWNATDCAGSLLMHYDKLTTGRTAEQRQDVLATFNELAEDHNQEIEESRRMIREGGSALPDFPGDEDL